MYIVILTSDTPKVRIYVAVSLKQSLSLESRWEICLHCKTVQDFNKQLALDQGYVLDLINITRKFHIMDMKFSCDFNE